MKTYPLSQSQLGVFLEMMQHPQMTQYNLGYMSSLPKSIDVDRLVQALKTIYVTRPEFRIRFLMEGDEPRQTVDDTRELPIIKLTMSESECEIHFSPFHGEYLLRGREHATLCGVWDTEGIGKCIIFAPRYYL